jgi:acyl-coenzyme A synthetase/AMP-(fatty) acid ligase
VPSRRGADFPPWRWDVPERFNIAVACTDAHLGTPVAGRTAMLVDDAALGACQLTFAELADRSARFAALLAGLGVGPGERVLIRLPNAVTYPVAFFGALRRGAVAVPTSTLLTADEVVHLARDSGAAALVTDPASWRAMHATLVGAPDLRHVLLTRPTDVPPATVAVHDLDAALTAVARPADPHPTRADDPAYLVYTSGTTGYPKGVLHAHRALLGRQPSSEYWFHFRPDGERVLHSGKLNWTYVLGTGMMDPLYHGHTAILWEGPADAALWPRLIARHAATTFIGVPTVYRQVLQRTSAGRADVPTLRHCMSAGEHLSDEVLAGWRRRFGLDVYEGLGMTECSYYLCQTHARPIRPGSAGFVQPGHEVRLLDPQTWREVGVDEEGMLCVPRTDPALFLRYWNQPEETRLCFHDDWFLTGDYARRDADGYVWFLGRRDDLINTFGYRVSPHEIDRVLRDHPDVADCAATGETVGLDKVLAVAYVVPRPGSALGAADVLAYGRRHLASYKCPRIVYLVDELPRTRNGKVLRRDLSPALARARASDADVVGP